MKFQQFSFGQIRIDGIEYGYDIVIDRGEIRERKKKPSKRFRDSFGHTPLSLEEEIPWKCSRLVVGTGTGALESAHREDQRHSPCDLLSVGIRRTAGNIRLHVEHLIRGTLKTSNESEVPIPRSHCELCRTF